jgi:alkanesulfonate monooxygenase SsuD/methylene tetrahydromethanopterin reductase-like flavin-dependent oxidoreductase (luciferase family)
MQPVETMAAHIQRYRDGQNDCEQPIGRFRNDRVGAYTLVHCYEEGDDLEASRLWDSVKWWYKDLAEFTIKWEMANLPQKDKDRMFPLLEASRTGTIDVNNYLAQDMIIIGTPDECLEKILKYEQAGVDQLLCYSQFGYLPHEAVMNSYRLLGEKVIPELERRGHRLDYKAMDLKSQTSWT